MMTGKHVYEAITAVASAMAREGIGKERYNEHQRYHFRSVDDVYAAVGRHLAVNKLCMLPRVVERTSVERATAKGGVSTYTTLTVDFDLVSAVDGSSHTIRTVGEAMDTADKSSNKAMSAAFKYAAFLAFQIPVEGEDNDADAHHIEPAPRAPKSDPSPVERELAEAFEAARTAEEIAVAEARAAKAVQEKKIVNGGRERLLKVRAAAVARLGAR